MCNFIKSPKEVKERLDQKGISVSAWAKSHGFSKTLVYSVLRGDRSCRIGSSHKIAVLLGMKEGDIGELNSSSGSKSKKD
ncbi:DNA-binding protein [Salmonella enterica]|nr:DNA-binding protein [Salmonella enterica]